MISSRFRTILLLAVVVLSLGVIAVLFAFGLLDPQSPIGPGGIVLSFCSSLAALLACVGLGRGASAIQLFDPEPDWHHEHREVDAPPETREPRTVTMSLVAFAIAYFVFMGLLVLDRLGIGGALVFLASGLIIFGASLWSLAAAAISVAGRGRNRLVAVLSGLMSLPLLLASSYWLYLGFSYLLL